jgi:hypothetical protein
MISSKKVQFICRSEFCLSPQREHFKTQMLVFGFSATDIKGVHKVHSGFWKIVARRQIELATCGLRQITTKLWKFFFLIPFKFHYHQTNIQCVHKVHSGIWKIVARKRNMRFAADYSETLEVFFYPVQIPLSPDKHTGVHKVHSGFWKILARRQIELATCGLRQITAELWKFFFYPIQIPLSPDKHTRCPQSPLGVLKNCGAQTNWASYERCTNCFHTFVAHTRSGTSLAIMDATSF